MLHTIQFIDLKDGATMK